MPQKKSASADLSVILIYCLFLSVRQKGTSHLSRTLWGNLLAGGWRFYFLTLYCCLGWVGDSYLRSKTSNIWGITSPRRYWRLRCTCSAISLKVRHWAQKSVIWLFKLVRLSACKVVRMWSCPRKRGKHRRKGANQAASDVLQIFPFFWDMQVLGVESLYCCVFHVFQTLRNMFHYTFSRFATSQPFWNSQVLIHDV